MSEGENRTKLDPPKAGTDPELVDALAKLSEGLSKGEDPLYYDWRNGSREPMPKRQQTGSRPGVVAAALISVLIAAALVIAFAWPRRRPQPGPVVAAVSVPAAVSSQSEAAPSAEPAAPSAGVVVPSAVQKPPRVPNAGSAMSQPSSGKRTGSVPVGPAEF